MAWLTGERKAVAAALLAFYSFLFMLVAMQPPPGWAACFVGLTAIYGLAFFSLVTGYFWARWFAMGLGVSGAMSAAISMFQIGMEPVLVFYGGTHLAVAVLLWGTAMAKSFDGRSEWRERFHLDEPTTNRLGKAVIRVGVSLPYIVMYALAPKDQGMGAALLAGAGLVAASAAFIGFLRMRTWAVLATFGGLLMLGSSLFLPQSLASWPDGFCSGSLLIWANGEALSLWWAGALGAGFLGWAVAPFVRPTWKYLSR